MKPKTNLFRKLIVKTMYGPVYLGKGNFELFRVLLNCAIIGVLSIISSLIITANYFTAINVTVSIGFWGVMMFLNFLIGAILEINDPKWEELDTDQKWYYGRSRLLMGAKRKEWEVINSLKKFKL